MGVSAVAQAVGSDCRGFAYLKLFSKREHLEKFLSMTNLAAESMPWRFSPELERKK